MSRTKLETREKILQAAVRKLEESGGRGVRMGDIAKETGISRQAVYLHFATRTDLLIAATLYRGDMLGVEDRLAPSRAASTGVERLKLYIEFWGNFIPEFYGVAKALMMAQDTDSAAAAAWRDRMLAMRDGCRAAIDALHADGMLAQEWTRPKATDALMAILQVPNWEYLTIECGWSNREYIRRMSVLAQRTFVDD
jgi:AcrR family transcriptional regulator